MLLSTGLKEYFNSNEAIDFKPLSKEDETPVKEDSQALQDKQHNEDLNVVKKRKLFT